jgi:hypothetical protein
MPQLRFPAAKVIKRFFKTHERKADALTRPELPQSIQISLNHLRDFRISADRLAIYAEHDALSIARDLDRSRAHGFGHELAPGHG